LMLVSLMTHQHNWDGSWGGRLMLFAPMHQLSRMDG